MAAITFRAGEEFTITEMAGSGLGFFGPMGFGYSVAVDEYQDTTYICNSDGTDEGPQVDNVKWIETSGWEGAGSVSGWLNQLPNYLATLNIRFTHIEAVNVQNVRMRAYYSTIDTAPTGIRVQGAEIIHPDETQNANGSGWYEWLPMSGSINQLLLANSPGEDGLNAGELGIVQTDQNQTHGGETASLIHDWYVAISITPLTTGSKTGNKLYVELEYL